MLSFLHPWGLLSLVSVGAVTFLYFFVFRGKRIEVSSLHLWRTAQSLRLEGRKKRRPPITLPFILEILSALLLSILAGGLLLHRPSDLLHLVVILDGSASMNAGEEGNRFRDRAARMVESFLDELGPRGRLTLVESGFEPRVLGREAMEKEAALAALASWRPSGPAHPLGPAIELARALSGEETDPILLTDHVQEIQGIRAASLGEALQNTGWSSSHWLGPSRLFALVEHFGEGGPRKTVAIFGDGARIGEKEVDFSKKNAAPFSIDVPDGVARLRLELPVDALPNDNVLLLARPPELKLPVQVDVKEPRLAEYIRRAVEATERGRLGGEEAAAVRFTDGASTGRGGLEVRIRVPEDPRSLAGPFLVNGFHPLTRGVELDGAIWCADPEFRDEGATRLLAAGEVPLALFDGRRLVLNIDPAAGNVFTMPAWPVLAANIVDFAFEQSPGLKRFSYRLGERLEFIRPPDWKGMVEVVGPEGSKAAFAEEHLYYGRLEREGIYRVLCAGEEKAVLDVNLLSELESDLTRAGPKELEGGLRPAAREEAGGRPLNREIILVILAMLLGCWFILERRSP